MSVLEDIEFSPYALHPRAPLNARHDGQARHGFLIRRCGGVGCVHPWPELGDDPVAEQLRRLKEGDLTPLLSRALDCATADGQARREKRSLFAGLTCPPSHATAPMGISPEEVAQLAAQWRREGFSSVKLKLAANAASATDTLRLWMEGGEDLCFRLDFNETGTREFFEDWLAVLPVAWRKRIDFIEDPVPWTEELWEWWGHNLPFDAAVDRRGKEADAWKPAGRARWRIVKPALEPVPQKGIWETSRVVYTSYMDHAVGQRFAAWEAARHGAATAGLLTHDLYLPDAFFAQQRTIGSRLILEPAAGETGLGLDELLATLHWEKL